MELGYFCLGRQYSLIRVENMVLTCVSVTLSNLAISALSLEERYFLISNCFSSSKICLPVKVVRAFFFLFFSLSGSLSWDCCCCCSCSCCCCDCGCPAAGEDWGGRPLPRTSGFFSFFLLVGFFVVLAERVVSVLVRLLQLKNPQKILSL